eukprot:TRINITY_DN12251_c0_g1_i2.p1 TRINITY_DN12251_c0_g1~~TRINITY_DN12251_c0_g1_i2.p1  ORF type:complete len:134 (+),score=15.36 TRINITY_DN12251_c0_g1_i2:41-442(+)
MCCLVFVFVVVLCLVVVVCFVLVFFFVFFFNDTATTEIYTRSIVGSVRCVQETGVNAGICNVRKRTDTYYLKAELRDRVVCRNLAYRDENLLGNHHIYYHLACRVDSLQEEISLSSLRARLVGVLGQRMDCCQ